MIDTKSKKDLVPWNKGKKGIYSEEQLKRMRESQKKRFEKESSWMKGRKHTLKSLLKMSESHKGKKLSEETKKKMSGRIPWNKGKKGLQVAWNKEKSPTEETKRKISEATKKAMSNPEVRKKLSEVGKGRPSPNKGKTASEETKRKISLSKLGIKYPNRKYVYSKTAFQKGHKINLGRKHSEEFSRKLSLIHKGMKFPWNSEPARQRILKLYESGSFPKQTNTKPERQIKEELLKRKYEEGKDFIHQYKFMNKFMCDFCFPQQKLIIEIDGDFWHANPRKYPMGSFLHPHQIKSMKKDKAKNAYIMKIDNGSWTLIRFWENDIKSNVSKCVDSIEEFLTEKNKV